MIIIQSVVEQEVSSKYCLLVFTTGCVRSPDSKAHPTELIFAYSAAHAVAAIALLNVNPTLGTVFSLSMYVESCRVLPHALLLPILHQVTR